MALGWPLPGVTRRKQAVMIMLSAIIPFIFIVTWLLAGSQTAVLDSHNSSSEMETQHPPHDDHGSHPDQHMASSSNAALQSPSSTPTSVSLASSPVGSETATTTTGTSPNSATDQSPQSGMSSSTVPQRAGATVKASTGRYLGKMDNHYDNVREFLNVSYGLPPTGKRRFAPPEAVPESSIEQSATEYALACPQSVGALPSIWSEQLPWYRIPHGPDEAGDVANLTDEDCLKLAIWTPANATEESKLPVALFWPGGGFQTNGILVPAHQPAQWVSRSQSHIVVTINYRLGILGFPGAGGAERQNLGLLDQRLALEWVRDNIEAFGGDPSRILVWGFSAGAQSVDFHNYAYYEDPIAHAYFAQSGSCLAFGSGKSDDYSKFTFVAKKFDCEYPDDYIKELECMQKVDWKELIGFLGAYNGNERLRFGPVVDDEVVFSDYKDRYASGKVSQVPMIYSSAANDGSSLAGYDASDPVNKRPDQETVNGITKRIMCGAVESAKLRQDVGLKTYRYQYAGVWKNQNPLWWLGSYHSSDLPMFFGTFAEGTGDAVEPLEAETSEAMQDALLSFMRNPNNVEGWPVFEPLADDAGAILRFGADGRPVQNLLARPIDRFCGGTGPYNPFP